MRDKTKYTEFENQNIEKVKDVLKEVLEDRHIKNHSIKIEIGRDRYTGELAIQGRWEYSSYVDSGRYSGFDDATYLIGKTYLDETTLKSDMLLDSAIDKMVSLMEKVPEKNDSDGGSDGIGAKVHLKWAALDHDGIENTIGRDPTQYRLQDFEILFEDGKLVENEEKDNDKNENNIYDNEKNLDDYNNKYNNRDDDDGGEGGVGGPTVELTPSYDEEDDCVNKYKKRDDGDGDDEGPTAELTPSYNDDEESMGL